MDEWLAKLALVAVFALIVFLFESSHGPHDPDPPTASRAAPARGGVGWFGLRLARGTHCREAEASGPTLFGASRSIQRVTGPSESLT